MIFAIFSRNNREKGLALILAIGFLAILSILGAVVLNVATRGLDETNILSSYTRADQQALYAADRAVEYSMNRDIIVNLAQYNSVNLMTDEVKQATSAGTGVNHNVVINATGPGRIVSGTVTDVGPRSLPPTMAAMHGSEFGANLYHVSVKTEAGLGRFKRNVHVDASIVRLFKMDDDQIFRTSGGG